MIIANGILRPNDAGSKIVDDVISRRGRRGGTGQHHVIHKDISRRTATAVARKRYLQITSGRNGAIGEKARIIPCHRDGLTVKPGVITDARHITTIPHEVRPGYVQVTAGTVK